MQPKVIKHKELVKQISEESGYHLYEIEDILLALSKVIAYNALNGSSSVVKGLGLIKYKEGHRKKGRSNLTGEEYNVITKNSLVLKIDTYMSNELNP